MPTPRLIQQVAELRLGPEEAARHGAGGTRASLRRAWPRSPAHVLLEYVTERGEVLPGQWMSDPALLDEVAGETRVRSSGGHVAIHHIGQQRVMIQSGGADRRLGALAALLADEHSSLIVHRPERRAVVRQDGDAQCTYAKVMRPHAATRLAESSAFIWSLPQRPFATPRLMQSDIDTGLLVFARLEGVPIIKLTGGEPLAQALRSAGQALRHVHESPQPPSAHPHSAEAEIRLLTDWLTWLGAFDEARAHELRAPAQGVIDSLRHDGETPVTLHRDFYDKQILITPSAQIGLLDFDTLSIGERALDVGNMLAHLELRALQGVWPRSDAEAAAAAFLSGYGADLATWPRAQAYLDAARLRLACLYSFRPRWMHLTSAMAARLGMAPQRPCSRRPAT